MKHAWISYAPLLVVTVLAISLGLQEAKTDSGHFSAESLENLRALNYSNQMAVDDLRSTERTALVSELIQANAFEAQPINKENLGLIVSTDEGDLLLLQPVERLSELELHTLAEEYEQAVPEFEAVELDQGLDLSGPFYDWDFGLSGENEAIERVDLATEEVTVAVIDSGLDGEHEIFTGTTVKTGWNTLDDDIDAYDDVGHGTHIAGIIASKAPGVSIIPYKIVNKNGGKLSNVLEAFSLALEEDVDVINTSFGLAQESYALGLLVDEAYEQGVIIISAAGNNAKDDGFYPAQNEHTIAVASVDSDGNKLPKSNYGNWIDVAAFGYHVRSSLPDGEYGYLSGTSQSTAVVSAAVVRLLQSAHTGGEWTYSSILSALKAGSEKSISTGELAGTAIIQ